ncbi:MAG: hypothetical protein RLZZ09_2790 [Pseudomonadota bacterium]
MTDLSRRAGPIPVEQPLQIDLLSTQLLRRGFLVETDGSSVYLSDNAFLRMNTKRPETIYLERHIVPRGFVSVGANRPYWERRDDDERPLSDQEVLEVLLLRMNLGGLVKTHDAFRPYRLMTPDHPLTTNQRRLLFDWPAIRSESFHDPDEGKLPWFTEHVSTPKIPLCLLEAHVALLVKAFSAVGCGIWYSCEGHLHRPHVRCQLIGAVHAFWAKYLLEDAAKAGLTPLVVVRNGSNFRMATSNPPRRPRNEASLERSQQIAMDIGEHVYRNRLRLREERVDWLRRYQERRRLRNANLDLWEDS